MVEMSYLYIRYTILRLVNTFKNEKRYLCAKKRVKFEENLNFVGQHGQLQDNFQVFIEIPGFPERV